MTDVRTGEIRVLAGEDLTDKAGFLVVMTHDTGIAEVKLPAANSDLALYAVTDEGKDGTLVSVEPIAAGRNIRAPLKGTCNPGDVLVLADTATPGDKGKVRALPAGVGTYRGIAIAEEVGVEGQHVLCRPALVGPITVSG